MHSNFFCFQIEMSYLCAVFHYFSLEIKRILRQYLIFMIRKQLFLLYIIIGVLSLLSCADNTHEEALCEAETLMNAEQYEEALALLDSIDGGLFQAGGRQQARYALLYTKAQYKNYIDSDNDSLISLAVDYAEAHGDKTDKFYAYLYQGIVRYLQNDYSEASVSLIRALANADEIDDHYSRGQMFAYLAMVNGLQQCSDEDYYAQKAYQEDLEGNLPIYAVSSMAAKAVAKLHMEDFDSARFWLDTCIIAATRISDFFDLRQAKMTKANYYILVDSVSMAEQLYQELLSDKNYCLSVADYGNLAYLAVLQGYEDLVVDYMSLARKLVQTTNDQITYWSKALRVSQRLSDYKQLSVIQDSLLSMQNACLNQALLHTSLATQRDYAEWQLAFERTQHRQKKQLLLSLFVCFLLLCFVFLQYYRRKSLQVQLQAEKIEKLQLQIKQHEKDMAGGLQIIKSSEVVNAINKMLTTTVSPHVDWDQLYALYCEKLPLFEKSLRELTSLSEIEWRVCMLIKLGFLPSQIAFLTNKSAEGVSSIRRRLYYKVFQKKGRPTDWDDFIKTL